MLILTIFDHNSVILLSAAKKSWQELTKRNCLAKKIVTGYQKLRKFLII